MIGMQFTPDTFLRGARVKRALLLLQEARDQSVPLWKESPTSSDPLNY